MEQQGELGFLIKQIYDAIGKKANAELKKNEMTLSQIRFIQYIAEKGGKEIPLKDVESFFNVSQPTIAGISRRLEIKKMVKTTPAKNDMRSKNVSLTSKGLKQATICSKNRMEMDERMLKSFSKEERAFLLTSLNKIRNELIKDD